jgi:hypothetical protein
MIRLLFSTLAELENEANLLILVQIYIFYDLDYAQYYLHFLGAEFVDFDLVKRP